MLLFTAILAQLSYHAANFPRILNKYFRKYNLPCYGANFWILN